MPIITSNQPNDTIVAPEASLSNDTPQNIGAAGPGVDTKASRSDHVHAHGNQTGGTQHAEATPSTAGFISASDKTKLDTVASGATNTALTASAPVDVTKATAVVGVASTAARSDHKHDITTAAPIAITDSTNSEGSATSLTRSDHTHAHGDRGGGSLHSVATTSVAGFMSAADKTIVDNASTLTSTAPVNVTKSAAVVGVGTSAARHDHKHDITTAATIELTDSTNAEGSATSLARSDHTHSHGTRGGGTLHANVTTSTAGFSSAADKLLIDQNIPITDSVEMIPYLEITLLGAAGAQATRVAQTTFEGASYFIPRRTSINRLIGRATAFTSPGTLKILLYQHTGGVSGTSATLVGTISGFSPGGTDNFSTTFSEGTVVLAPGMLYLLWGRDSATGSVTMRTRGTTTTDLFVANTDANTHPLVWTTAIATTTTPATFDPVGSAVTSTTDSGLIMRFRTV